MVFRGSGVGHRGQKREARKREAGSGKREASKGEGPRRNQEAKCEKAVKRKVLAAKAGIRRYSIFRADCGIFFIWKIQR
jgi:hypothetical protein